jgi:5-formyltetrahydrofolate cyclo-ligase
MEKQTLRRHIWSLMTERNVVRFPGAEGRIPNFVGAEAAARRLADLPEWQSAEALKCNPDMPQLPVRTLALQQGKTVYMAVPRLSKKKCFFQLDPARVKGVERRAASIKGASRLGHPLAPKDMPHIDLIIAGSVAVRRDGARVGKGGGFSDLEYGLAAELGLVDETTPIVTTVHPVQITEHDFPILPHDIPLDYIVTPEETIHCPRAHNRPQGILWEYLSNQKVEETPILREQRAQERSG